MKNKGHKLHDCFRIAFGLFVWQIDCFSDAVDSWGHKGQIPKPMANKDPTTLEATGGNGCSQGSENPHLPPLIHLLCHPTRLEGVKSGCQVMELPWLQED